MTDYFHDICSNCCFSSSLKCLLCGLFLEYVISFTIMYREFRYIFPIIISDEDLS